MPNPNDPNPPPGHDPNQTNSTDDPQLPPGVTPLPRDPSQPIHRKPRVFIHRMSEDPSAETDALANTSYIDALRTVQLSDFTKVHRTPCFRDAMLPGIGGAAGLGALRFVVGGSMARSGRWAGFGFLGISMVMYQVCQRRRRNDKEGIRKAVAVLDEKNRVREGEEAERREREGVVGKAEGAAKSVWSTFKFW